MPSPSTLHARASRTIPANDLFAGEILDDATDLDSLVRMIGSTSAAGHTYGPCEFIPNPTNDSRKVMIPKAGDPCLIGIDDQGNSWIVAWSGGAEYLVEEDWHEVGAGGEPAFQNSWANKGGAYETLAFRKVGNVVWLKGSVGAGSLNTTIFTLPTGYRPAKDRRKGISGYDAGTYYVIQLYITSAGLVQVQSTGPSGAVDEVHIEYGMVL